MIIATPDSIPLNTEIHSILLNTGIHSILLNTEIHSIPLKAEIQRVPLNTEIQRVPLKAEHFQNFHYQVTKTSRRDLSKLKTPVLTGKFSDLPLL